MQIVSRQTSFAGGVLSPTLHARDDIPQYRQGLRELLNFFVTQHGAVQTRPGMVFVRQEKAAGGVSSYCRLLPFVYSDSFSFALEFGQGYIRFHRRGQTLRTDGTYTLNTGTPFEIATVFQTEQRLRNLKYAQYGSSLYIVPGEDNDLGTGSTNVYRLTRGPASNLDWTWSVINFDLQPFTGTLPTFRKPVPTATVPDFPAKKWEWRITQVFRRPNGTRYETMFHVPNQLTEILNPAAEIGSPAERIVTAYGVAQHGNNHVVYNPNNKAMEFDFQQFGDGGFDLIAYMAATGDVWEGTRFYRGRGKVFGKVGEQVYVHVNATVNDNLWSDHGDDPDFENPPPEGENPFRKYDDVGTITDLQIPFSICFHEQRLWFGGTPEREVSLLGSEISDFHNFDRRYLATTAGAIFVELAAAKKERIRHLLSYERMLAFTNAGVWVVGSRVGGVVTPVDPPDFKLHVEVGSANNPAPLKLSDAILYVRSKGSGIRDLIPSPDQDGLYVGGDISFLAQHLFDGHEIVDWCWAEDPYNIVWMVRDDGKLISLTYSKALNMSAFALHETDGVVESIVSIPEDTEDVVYIMVLRNGKRYIERLAKKSEHLSAIEDTICLDGAYVYSGGATNVITGLNHLKNKDVYVNADGFKYGPLRVDFTTGELTLPAGVSVTHAIIGLAFTPQLELLDSTDHRTKQKAVKLITIEVEASRGLYAGQTYDKMQQWKQKSQGLFDVIPLESGRIQIRCGSRYNKFGRAVIRQTEPFPLRVLGVTREGEIGGSA